MKDHGLIALSDIAKKLRITRQGVFLRIKRHKIPYERLGGIAVVRREHLHLIYKKGKAGRPNKKRNG